MSEFLSEPKLVELIENDLSQFHSPTQISLSLPDIWIAKSLLQKAIRRNDIEHALRATMFAIDLDEKSFWRRLPIIAWEDVGLTDIDLCNAVGMLARSKRLRTKLGGEWPVASYLVTKLCHAIKDRSSDDLLTVIEHDRDLQPMRDRLAFCTAKHRRTMIQDGSVPLELRAIALHYALGTDRFGSDHLHRTAADGDLMSILQSIDGCSDELAFICADATKRTGTVLPAIASLLWSKSRLSKSDDQHHSDEFGFEYEISSIPRYAFDGNTRSGRKYLHWLASIDESLSSYLQSKIPKSMRQPLVRKLYFRSKSSLCANRQLWETGSSLRQRADEVGYGLTVEEMEEGTKLLAIAMLRYPMSEEHL